MKKIVTGLMGLTMAAALVGTASADHWHHNHRHYGYYAPAPRVVVAPAPRRVYYPAPYAAPACAAPVVVAPAPAYGGSVGFSTRRFSFGLGF